MFFMKMGLNDSLVSFSIATLLFLLHLLLWEERYLRNYVRNNNDIEKVAKLQKHVLREDDLKILQRKEFPEVGNDNTVLLTLFSTWKRGLENKKVYNNTIHVWATLKPWVKVVFFGDEGDLDPNAQKLNWHFLPVSQTHCNGTPVLKSMFRDVYEHFDSTFYGYANGDILFDRGLIDTLLALKKSALHKQDKMMLLSGRRIDIYLGSGENVTDIKGDVAVLSLKGAISYGYAADYFITTRTFPWEKIPNFVVGRPQYDNFLLYMSRQHHVHVIDASMTIVALHQRTKERKKSKDECNERIMKEAHIYRKRYVQLGHLDCAKYETRFNNTGEVLIIKRERQFTDIKHSHDIWHVAKNLGKKLVAAGQDKECKDILKWTQDITTHFWHACKHANTYGEFLTIWAGVLHHVVDEHEWALSYGSMDYGQCSHSALETDREKPWLKKGSKAHEALRRIVLDKRLLNNVPYYLNFRSTAELENFHTHILMYAAKRFAYTPPVYKARSQLAAIDYNEHIERPAALTKEGKKIYHRTFNKKSERWSAVEVKVKKTYAYIKNLLHNIFCMRLRDRVGMNRRMELAPDDPRRLSSHLASVEPKPTSELVTEKLSRF